MPIRSAIAKQSWLSAALEEAARTYAAQGYDVTKDALVGTQRADLMVRKGDAVIVLAFKLGAWSRERSEAMRQLRHEVVQHLGGKFKLVVVTPPEAKNIEVAGIDTILYTVLQQEQTLFAKLAPHVQLETVSDVAVNSIELGPQRMRLAGTGLVAVGLEDQASPAPMQGMAVAESFPFAFAIVLDSQFNLLSVEELSLDPSG